MSESSATSAFSQKLATAASPYQQRWQQLPERDRLALGLLGGFLAILIIVYGIVLPSYDFHKQARDRFDSDTQLLQWLQAQETAVKQLPKAQIKPTASSQQSPLTFVTQSAKQHQLSLKRVQPEGSNKLRLWLESAPMDKSLNWLKGLSQGGLVIDDISIERQGPQGMANIRATLISQ
jgi:general secretion pathway protein M